MRKLITIILAAGILSAIPALAQARALALHGSQKVAMVDDAYFDNGNGDWTPNNWLVYHCTSAWELSGNQWRWGIWTTGPNFSRACNPVASNGANIMYVDRADDWINDEGFDEPEFQYCDQLGNGHLRGAPRAPGTVVRQLLEGMGTPCK